MCLAGEKDIQLVLIACSYLFSFVRFDHTRGTFELLKLLQTYICTLVVD